MTMASTLRRHLEGVEYQVVNHPMTASSSETAQSAHVSGNRIAKSVVLRDGEGYLLAVLPATHHLSLEMLQDVEFYAWLEDTALPDPHSG